MTTDKGYKVEQVINYFLNSGFIRYTQEPFISYSALDWIEYANEYELEIE